MKINLKRALKLRKELEAHLHKMLPDHTIEVSLVTLSQTSDFQSVKIQFDEKQTELQDKVMLFTQLSSFLAALRCKIAAANMPNVENMLAEVAHCDRQLTFLGKIVAAKTMLSAAEVDAMIVHGIKQMDKEDTGYHRPSSELKLSALTQDMQNLVKEQYMQIKRRKEELDDNRTAFNAQTSIEISDDMADLLRQEGLI